MAARRYGLDFEPAESEFVAHSRVQIPSEVEASLRIKRIRRNGASMSMTLAVLPLLSCTMKFQLLIKAAAVVLAIDALRGSQMAPRRR